jgi:hypothetical protein
MNELLPAMSKGALEEGKEKKLQQNGSLLRYVRKVILQNNLDVPTGYFWKELLRDQGFTVGRLDSRYKGIDKRCWRPCRF